MVRSIHKLNILSLSLAAILLACSPALPTSAAEIDLELNITEILHVSVTAPDAWASGDVDAANGSDLLRNKVTLNVASNNPSGFTATMYSKTTTDLIHQTKSDSKIPTLSAATTAGAFPVNSWGYSTDDTDAGLDTANYAAMSTTDISLASSTGPATESQDIFFGARADVTKDSGTYANTVVFAVTTAVITDTPSDPKPVEPSEEEKKDEEGNDRVPVVDYIIADTATGNSEDDDSKPGDTNTSYADPQGVTTTNIGSGTPLATGLAVTAGVAATSGILFFIVAKKKKDEEEDEEEI